MPWAIADNPQIYVTPLITGIKATKTDDAEKPSYVVYPPRGSGNDFINARFRYKVSAYSPIVKESVPFSSFKGHFQKEYDPFDAYIVSHNIGVGVLDEYLNPLLCNVMQAPVVYTLPDFLRIDPMKLGESAMYKIDYIAQAEIKRESAYDGIPRDNAFVKNLISLQNEISILEGNHR
jgi:hypothetical protein